MKKFRTNILERSPVLVNYQRLTYISSVLATDAVERTCQERRMIGISGERFKQETPSYLHDLLMIIYIYILLKIS